jgi:hypothetical protein
MVQGKPENYQSQFKVIVKNDDVFSDKLYLDQLLLHSQSIEKSILNTKISNRFDSILDSNITGESKGKVFIKDHKGVVDD